MSNPNRRSANLRIGLSLICCLVALTACQAPPVGPANVLPSAVTQPAVQAAATPVEGQNASPSATRPLELPANTVSLDRMSASAKPTVRPTVASSGRKPAAQRKTIILLGHLDHGLPSLARYLQDVAGYKVLINAQESPADLVLVVVSAIDGPMPMTRQAIELMDGQSAAHAAILLTNSDHMNDPELRELVLLEIRELLVPYIGYEQAEALPTLLSPSSTLLPDLRALLAAPAAPVEFTLPPADHQPILFGVYVSEDESSGHLVLNQYLDFVDPDGDVDSVLFEVVSADVDTLTSFYAQIDATAAEQSAQTTVAVPWDCAGEAYTATLTATLSDGAGNWSNPVEYSITCFAP